MYPEIGFIGLSHTHVRLWMNPDSFPGSMSYQTLMKVNGVVEESWSAITTGGEGNQLTLKLLLKRNLKGTSKVKMPVVMVKLEKV